VFLFFNPCPPFPLFLLPSIDLQVLLSGNLITHVPSNYFQNISATIETVHLHKNSRLTTLPPGLFSGMPHLHTVVCHHSAIEAVPAGLFANSASLSSIWMHSNAITSVAADAFAGVGSSLKELWLHDNSISAISPGTFAGLTGLEDLLLTGNPLEEGSFTCGLLCDVAVTSNVEVFANATGRLYCGASCSVDEAEGQIGEWVSSDVCGYDQCESWDLGAAGGRWRKGAGVGAAAAVVGLAGALALL